MMDDAVQDAVNEQIGKEFYAGYLYLAMSAHFERESLLGFARWMRVQAQEELEHAMKLFGFMNQRGATVQLRSVDAPPTGFEAPLSLFEQALEHEREVSRLIHKLYDLAVQKHDHATQLELQWFITEQVEEEANVGTVVDQLRMAGDNEAAILMLDRELGQRTLTE
ncbi:MAG: ferritin [Gemmatimonadetes bacterium]|nr:ferritin [Gemmatimonadota bacterium]